MIDLEKFREDNNVTATILDKSQDVAAVGYVFTGQEDKEGRQIVRIIYDLFKLVELIHDSIPLDKCDGEEDRWEQAEEYVEYNTLGSFPNEEDVMAPIFMNRLEE